MRRSSAIALALACTAILGWVAYALADPPTGTVTSYAIPAGGERANRDERGPGRHGRWVRRKPVVHRIRSV